MGAEYNFVEYNYAGIVGGSHNTVNNYLYADTSFFKGGTNRRKGNEHLHFLLLFDDSMDDIREAMMKKLDSALAGRSCPVWIEMTEFANACARIVYFNGGPNDEDVRKLINRFFTLACFPYGFEYQAQIVGMGSQYYFEMYPQY